MKKTIWIYSTFLLTLIFLSGCENMMGVQSVSDANRSSIMEYLLQEAEALDYEDFTFAEGEDETQVRSEFSFPVLLNNEIEVKWTSDNTGVHISNDSAQLGWHMGSDLFTLTAELTYKDCTTTKDFELQAHILELIDFGNMSPMVSATDVPVSQQIRIPFNADLNPTTLTTTTVVLHDGRATCSRRVNFEDGTLIITPYKTLEPHRTYSVWLSKYIRVEGRDILGDDFFYTFVTGSAEVIEGFVEDNGPKTITADFSYELYGIYFDMSYHGEQSLYSRVVEYDTKSLIGSDHDDRILFSSLEDGEVFDVDGGGGFNILDLSNYLSNDVMIQAGYTGEDEGSVIVYLSSGGFATINYKGFKRIQFSANNFTGSPHAIELDTSDNTRWDFYNKVFELSHANTVENPGLLYFEGNLQLNYVLNTILYPYTDQGWKNGLIIFDYQDDNNYKYIQAHVAGNKWSINEVIGGSKSQKISFDETIDVLVDNEMELRVTGADGKTAEVWSGGAKKTEFTFSDPLNDGFFGISTRNAHSQFTIDMKPSDWAPYAKILRETIHRTVVGSITIDLLAQVSDYEGQTITLESVGTPAGGTIVDKGDGTVTYTPDQFFFGLDSFQYRVSDGTNITESTVYVDVLM